MTTQCEDKSRQSKRDGKREAEEGERERKDGAELLTFGEVEKHLL
jgi:hypothetical protein